MASKKQGFMTKWFRPKAKPDLPKTNSEKELEVIEVAELESLSGRGGVMILTAADLIQMGILHIKMKIQILRLYQVLVKKRNGMMKK